MSYGVMHRYFLRTVASQGVLTYSNAQNVLEDSFPDAENKSIEDICKAINDKISPFGQTIKIVTDEVTSEKNVVFLSLSSDDTTKSQNVFSPQELDYFRVLIEQIMTTESRQVTSQYALNLVNNLKLTKTAAEKLLTTWCRMHYLTKTNANYALGIRAIQEFKNYLRENMPDTIQDCCLCKDIVFRGYNCPPCGEPVHIRCLNQYLQKVKKWPCCKADFHESQLETLISSGAPPTPQPGLSQTQRTQATPRTSQRIMSVEDNSDDEFEQTMGTPIPGISQRFPMKRKRSQK